MGLDLILTNYHPISNLFFVSKLVEWVVCQQITKFAEESGNLESMQTAYHESHSTETALLKVKSGILNAMNNKEVMCLVLLDLSVTFDTMNHQLLLNCLKYHFGFQGKVLQQLKSYLTGHTQKGVLKNGGKTSESESHPFHIVYFTPGRLIQCSWYPFPLLHLWHPTLPKFQTHLSCCQTKLYTKFRNLHLWNTELNVHKSIQVKQQQIRFHYFGLQTTAEKCTGKWHHHQDWQWRHTQYLCSPKFGVHVWQSIEEYHSHI